MKFLLAFLTAALCFAADPRNIREGLVIPDESYSDQPYIVKTNDGAWLCTMTTGAGFEGAGGQHIITLRSTDRGKTWSTPVSVEPADGPEASYAVLLKIPSGRVFAFYNHNTDNLREIKGDDLPYKDGIVRRVDSFGHFVYKYSDDHGLTWSAKRYEIPSATSKSTARTSTAAKPNSSGTSAALSFTKALATFRFTRSAVSASASSLRAKAFFSAAPTSSPNAIPKKSAGKLSPRATRAFAHPRAWAARSPKSTASWN